MNVHFTYKVSKTPDVENQIDNQVQKLRRRLQVFKPDMVSLHGAIDENAKIGFTVSLNLRLPSGQMAARTQADSAQAAVRTAFDDLIEQLSKHKDLLRAQHQWPRHRRVGRTRPVPQVPFEETLAAVKLEEISGQDITSFVDANLGRLRRFVDRELLFRRNNGQDQLRDVQADEVISEAIANALDDRTERPEKVSLEPWLFRQARIALERIANSSEHNPRNVSLDETKQLTTNTGDDDSLRQLDIDNDTVSSASLVADQGASPEEIIANDEVVAMVQTALRRARPEDREAFVLFVFEGFTVNELSAITDRSGEDIRKSIRTGRDMLRKSMPARDPITDRIIERSKIA